MSSSAFRAEPLEARLAGQTWRLIEDEPAPGAWNMAVDDALLEAARRNETAPVLRLYAWSRPTLSLGRHQDPRAGIDHAFRERSDVDLVRRPTGGRAVLHDLEVTYSVVLPAALGRGIGVGEVYCALSRALLAGLEAALGVGHWALGQEPDRPSPPGPLSQRQGVGGLDRVPSQAPLSQSLGEAGEPRLGRDSGQRRGPGPGGVRPRTMPANCFATAAGGDGVLSAGKLVGSAQARRAGAVLQHGSVLLGVREELWHGLFGGAGLEVPLAALIQPPPGPEPVLEGLRRGLERGLGACLCPGRLTPAEWSEAERLVADRYGVGCLD